MSKIKELLLLIVSYITAEFLLVAAGITLMTIGTYQMYAPAGFITCGFLMLRLGWPDEGSGEE